MDGRNNLQQPTHFYWTFANRNNVSNVPTYKSALHLHVAALLRYQGAAVLRMRQERFAATKALSSHLTLLLWLPAGCQRLQHTHTLTATFSPSFLSQDPTRKFDSGTVTPRQSCSSGSCSTELLNLPTHPNGPLDPCWLFSLQADVFPGMETKLLSHRWAAGGHRAENRSTECWAEPRGWGRFPVHALSFLI